MTDNRILQFQEISIGTLFLVWHDHLKQYEKISELTGEDIDGNVKEFEKIDLVIEIELTYVVYCRESPGEKTKKFSDGASAYAFHTEHYRSSIYRKYAGSDSLILWI